MKDIEIYLKIEDHKTLQCYSWEFMFPIPNAEVDKLLEFFENARSFYTVPSNALSWD